MKQKVIHSNGTDTTKVNRPISQLPIPGPDKQKMDKETVQILVDDRVATGG